MKKKTIFLLIMVGIICLGLITITSCKRKEIDEPQVQGPDGFHISLSGRANPATLYVPQSEPAVSSQITVTVLNNDASPVANHQVIFQEEMGLGYFDGYKISDIRTTDANGVARINFFIPPLANVKNSIKTNIIATLVDDNRLDNNLARIDDVIPIQVIPYVQQGVMIHGHITSASGNGIGGIPVYLVEDSQCPTCCPSAVTVTRSSGSYEFYVKSGWAGTITPQADSYSFTPESYSFSCDCPVIQDIMNLDFVGAFAGGETLTADITQWDVLAIGGTVTVNIYNSTGDASIAYTAIPDAPWISVSPNSGSTPGQITIIVSENTTGEERQGAVNIAATNTQDQTLTINIDQAGNEVSGDARLAVDVNTINAPVTGITTTVNVYNSGSAEDIDYIITVIGSPSWISTGGKTDGTTDDNIDITVSPNNEGARTAQIRLTPTSTGATQEVLITINQEAGAAVAVDITSRSVQAAGENFTVTITNSTNTDTLTFTLSNADSWISASPTSGTTPATVTVIVDSNGTGQVRTGVITVTANNGSKATITISQDPS